MELGALFVLPPLPVAALLKNCGSNKERWLIFGESLPEAAVTAAITALCTSCALYLIRRLLSYIRFVQKVNAIPGPSLKELHPLYGHFKSLMDTIGTIPNRPKLPHLVGFFLQQLPPYKDDGIVRFWMFHPYYNPFMARTSVLVLDPQWTRQLLTEKAYYEKLDKEQRIYKMASSLIGSSFLAMPDGPIWKHQRKMAAPAFNANFLQHAHDTVLQFLEKFFFPYYDRDESADKDGGVKPQLLEAMEWSGRLTLDVIGSMSFSQDFGGMETFAASKQKQQQQQSSTATAQNEHASTTNDFVVNDNDQEDTLYSAFVAILMTIALRNLSPLFHNKYLPTEENRKFRKATQRIDGTIQGIVKERLRMEEAGLDAQLAMAKTQSNAGKKHQDILSYMLQKDADTGERLSFHSLFANMRMVLFAGHDTTAATVAWALWELAQNPDVQDKLYAEIVGAGRETAKTKSTSSTIVSYKSIAALPYLDAVVRETLRLHGPAVVGRVAIEDIELRHPKSQKTVLIPKGTKLFIAPIYIQRIMCPSDNDSDMGNAKSKAESKVNSNFDPERFLVRHEANKDGITTDGHDWFLPFSVGPRNCVGQPMAVAETKSILFHLVKRYYLKLPTKIGGSDAAQGFTSPVHVVALTIKPHEVWIDIQPRRK
ncbi:hypothetical protein ACA910_008943 [Epithemia clementina (nom. ined.)]